MATNRISIDSSGNEGNNNSLYPSISADRRYIAFESSANNLITNDINDGTKDIFVRDLQANTTRLISLNSNGLLISAYLFFYQPDRNDYSVLDKFILDSNATRKTGNEIANYLKDGLSILDIDGSGGQPIFARDGLLISAYLFFYQPDRNDYSVLDKFILDSNATRKTGNEIANYLKNLMGVSTAPIYADNKTIVNANSGDILGTLGNDILAGDFENNHIFGDTGDDLLTGGIGKDSFVFGIDSGLDSIVDFTVGEDLIQIDSKLGFEDGAAVFAAVTNLGMRDSRFVSELVLDGDNQVTIFSDEVLNIVNFSITFDV
jgi:RTX calcium-binding nonapeptide repeat (4 copies)